MLNDDQVASSQTLENAHQEVFVFFSEESVLEIHYRLHEVDTQLSLLVLCIEDFAHEATTSFAILT